MSVYNQFYRDMHKAVKSYLETVRAATIYGIEQRLVRGRKPTGETAVPSGRYMPGDPLEVALLESRAGAIVQKWEVAKASPDITDVSAELADWHCLNFKGDCQVARMHLRIYGKAGEVAGQIARLSTSWDIYRKEAVEFAVNRGGGLITEINADVRRGINGRIATGIEQGESMNMIAKDLRSTIGLHSRQTNALRRFSDTLATKFADRPGGLTPARIARLDRAVEREAKRKLAYRATMIARTETAFAVTQGTLDAYKEGEVSRVRWESAGDPCEICLGYDGTVWDLKVADGLIPAHPNCRCTFIPEVGANRAL